MKKSKNIVITGASTGIGYALAKAFVHAGYQVYGSVRKEKDAKRLRSELGSGCEPLLFDVTDHQSVDQAAKQLEERLGKAGIGGLINNAGVAIGGPFMDVDIEEFSYQFEVNVIGLVKVTQAFLPLLGARKGHENLPGKILQISSVAGKVAMPFLSPYVGSKHAVEGISQSLRRELQYFGIDVIVVGPGSVKTPIWNKRSGEAQGAKYQGSPYHKPLQIFQNVFVAAAIKNGWTSEKAAYHILRAFENPKPKTRYALVPQKFKNWILPRWVPPRMLDKLIRKSLKLYSDGK